MTSIKPQSGRSILSNKEGSPSMDEEWLRQLQVAINDIREDEARKTLFFKKRAETLWKDCFGMFQALIPDVNSLFRNSNLISSIARSDYNPLNCWIELRMHELDRLGAEGNLIFYSRMTVSKDGNMTCASDVAEFPDLSLDHFDGSVIKEILYHFATSSLRSYLESPKWPD